MGVAGFFVLALREIFPGMKLNLLRCEKRGFKMQTVTHQLPATSAAQSLPVYPALEQVTRPTVPTDQAAYYLNRQPQTLRAWACLENGPLRPRKISGRLAWPISEIRALLNGGR